MSINTSKIKRDMLLGYLSNIKEFVSKNPDSSLLLDYISELEEEIKYPSYGLVFEKHYEDIERILETNDTEMVEQKELFIQHGRRENLLIEGENLAVLRHLVKSYTCTIDVVCVDPPYNTGMSTLNYNDQDYADIKDLYIHSKWLSFMEKRLSIAKNLLTDNGVIFINIDEHETGTLILLCQQLFGEDNINVLIWPKTDPKFDQNRVEKGFHNIKIVHEYVIVCFKNKSQTLFNHILVPMWSTENEYKETQTHMESILKGFGTTSSAKDELAEIFGNRYLFQTPKPKKLIKELVRATAGKNAVILDFFAGSGTTGHAVMDLNKEDHGQRRFILATNNENDICRKITYERLKKAIEKEKYEESLKYLKINYYLKKSMGY